MAELKRKGEEFELRPASDISGEAARGPNL